jgi:hypothetical protein
MHSTCGSVRYKFTYLSGRCVRLWRWSYYSPSRYPCHEGVCVSGSVDPHSANPRTTWRWQLTFTLGTYYRRGKSTRYFSDKTSMDGTQSRSGPCGEVKNMCPWQEFSPDYAFCSLVTILKELYMHPRLISFRESLSSQIKHIFYLICWNIWTIWYTCCIEYRGWICVLQPFSSFHFALFHTPEFNGFWPCIIM